MSRYKKILPLFLIPLLIFIALVVLRYLIPAFNSLPIAILSVQKEKIVNLNEEFTLQKNEIAKVKDTDISLKIKDFINSKCPQGTMCIWSGQTVIFELIADGKTYTSSISSKLPDTAPYNITVKKSDYETYATFIINTYPRYGHASDYSWLAGTLQYYTLEGGCWTIVFTDKQETNEPYNGRLALDIPTSQKTKIQDGNSVIVKGKLGKSSFSMACLPQHYEAEKIILR